MYHPGPATVDDERMVVTRTVRVDASIQTVWDVLTDPEHIAGWFGQTAVFEDGVHVGAHGTFGWGEHGDFPVRIDAYDPPHTFAFTWGTPGQPIRDDNATTATFTLREIEGFVELSVVESGFEELGDAAAARAAMEDTRQGWTEELDDLVAYVATLP